MSSIIEEVKEITAAAVAKKQDAAKLNYTKIIEQIKVAAGLGKSDCRVSENQMNEYDKQLLEKDGFKVMLIDKEKPKYDQYDAIGQFSPYTKEWIIKW